MNSAVNKALVVFVLLLSLVTQAKPQHPYYDDNFRQQIAAHLDDVQLKAVIGKYISSPRVNLGYDRARTFIFSEFYVTHENNSYIVKDVYCEKDYVVPAPNNGFPDGGVINVEHTWPQSKFSGSFPKDLQKSDIHHLFPTDSGLNADRASYTFGEVFKDKKPLKCNISRLGYAANSSQVIFEPPVAHRGNVARALFYFAVNYQMRIDNQQEAFLRKWDREDPVDDEEELRNDEIFKIQKNRNPFIDFPNLADQIKDF
jgi:deoxyribonuclease I